MDKAAYNCGNPQCLKLYDPASEYAIYRSTLPIGGGNLYITGVALLAIAGFMFFCLGIRVGMFKSLSRRHALEIKHIEDDLYGGGKV